jgi:hypothetical protein
MRGTGREDTARRDFGAHGEGTLEHRHWSTGRRGSEAQEETYCTVTEEGHQSRNRAQ